AQLLAPTALRGARRQGPAADGLGPGKTSLRGLRQLRRSRGRDGPTLARHRRRRLPVRDERRLLLRRRAVGTSAPSLPRRWRRVGSTDVATSGSGGCHVRSISSFTLQNERGETRSVKLSELGLAGESLELFEPRALDSQEDYDAASERTPAYGKLRFTPQQLN